MGYHSINLVKLEKLIDVNINLFGNQFNISGNAENINKTLNQMLMPCLFAALTTGVAFLSLLVGDIKPVIDESRPTSLKQRYRAGNKTLLRVSHLRQHKINKTLQQQMRDHVFAALVDADLLIFSDFNYGVLPQDLVDEISKECIKRGIYFAPSKFETPFSRAEGP